MTPQQIEQVKTSWQKVMPIREQAVEMFYTRLFALEPSVRTLFRGDMNEQGRKLMTMITTAVSALDRLETIMPAVQDLGRRHAGYGVRDEHYDTVGAALLKTLRQGLGAAWVPEVEEAWSAVYGVLAGTMKEAAAVPA